ncbi:protein RALF-like 24 [Coffea arabica]|uniref:Protein RALF-like 24 n=1 Tax=Coffea arabica TaxID=13443 RepID=A0A6P6WWW1_COFAR|nr:protein RALF-like 24 [Coffea arabica]
MLKTQQHPLNTLILVMLVLFLVKMCCGMSVLDLNSMKNGELDAMVKRACAGKMSDCPTVSLEEEEEEMDSESHRRMLLMRRRFISYDTLRRDFAPCDRPGSSYYNCKAAGPVNTYNRGCEIITRCGRGD